MRAPWTLSVPSEFYDQLVEIHQQISNECRQALNTGRHSDAHDLLRREEEFDNFWKVFKALTTNAHDSMNQLRKVGMANDGTEIYAILSGRWVALFRVARSQNLCTAIKIKELSWWEAATERVRHAFRFPLQ